MRISLFMTLNQKNRFLTLYCVSTNLCRINFSVHGLKLTNAPPTARQNYSNRLRLLRHSEFLKPLMLLPSSLAPSPYPLVPRYKTSPTT